jgi:Zn finger protein HypA/HybF involved in hydrogenase expression
MNKPQKQRCECSSCDALFFIEHDMAEKFYPVTNCPFCGDELDIEEELELDYGEEYDV